MVDDEVAEQVVSACRTAIGDELRSVTYFTEREIDQLYLRGDLERSADLVGFSEVERLGFRAQIDYRRTELGEYLFTIRVFDGGYLLRVIAGDQGVFVTTDTMSRDRFEEVAASVRSILSED
jgi:hypothetical protein